MRQSCDRDPRVEFGLGVLGGESSVRKPGPVEVTGIVRDLLPNALFRVELDSRHQVLAHASGEVGRNFLRLLAGDRVLVELSPFDPGRGRIVRRV